MSSPKLRPAIEGGTPIRPEPLPFYRAPITEDDVAAVADTLRSGWLTVGPKTEAFEHGIAAYTGARHAVAVSSCSDGMIIALRAAGVKPGDEVITSALTFASTVHAIVHVGAIPVLADIESETFGVNPDHVEALITPRTRVIMPVHFGGQACRIGELMAIARRHELRIVEDAAHAFGAQVGGRRIGTFGDATAFSFYATKNLTTGEGGAVTTNQDDVAERVRLLSYHGMSRDSWTRYSDRGSWYYEVLESGYKSNLNDMQAALGLSQLSRLDGLIAQRRVAAVRMIDRLTPCEQVTLPVERFGNFHTWHLFVIRVHCDSLRIGRNRFIEALHAENISCSVHFIPVYRHPFWALYHSDSGVFPECESYYEQCISLPLFPGMSEGDCDDVAEAVTRIARYYAT